MFSVYPRFSALTASQFSLADKKLVHFPNGQPYMEHITRLWRQPEDQIVDAMEEEGDRILNGQPLAEDTFQPSENLQVLETALLEEFQKLLNQQLGLRVNAANYILDRIKDSPSFYLSDAAIERLVAISTRTTPEDKNLE